jgi:hypothetical protein
VLGGGRKKCCGALRRIQREIFGAHFRLGHRVGLTVADGEGDRGGMEWEVVEQEENGAMGG